MNEHDGEQELKQIKPGPNMTAFHSMILSAQGAPEMPLGGSDERCLKSRIRRRRHEVDYNAFVSDCQGQ